MCVFWWVELDKVAQREVQKIIMKNSSQRRDCSLKNKRGTEGKRRQDTCADDVCDGAVTRDCTHTHTHGPALLFPGSPLSH